MVDHQQAHRFPWESLLFALSLVVLFGYYAYGVHADARGVTDWLLILPAAGIGITALLVIACVKVIDWYADTHRLRADVTKDDTQTTSGASTSARPALFFMGLLALYVGLIPVIGFDIGSFLFLCLTLYLQGERRWWVMAGIGLTVSLTVTLIFIELLNVRLPTLLL